MSTKTMMACRLAVTLGMTSIAVGCDGSPTEEFGGPAVLSVHLTDAPGDVAAVWVDVAKMYFQGTPEGRTTIQSEPSGLVELTSLVGTTRELVSGLELPAGRYKELRMVLSAGVLETTAGDVYSFGGAEHPDGMATTGELRCPSCSTSGLKAKLGGDEVTLESGAQVLLLDFDVSQSFGRAAGGSNAWVMHPVINGTVQVGAAPDVGASVSGLVSLGTDSEGGQVVIPACPADQPRTIAEFIPTATATTLFDGGGAAIMKSGVTAEDGTFAISAMDTDTWALGYHSEVVYGEMKLVFEAAAEPMEVAVDGNVSGVFYTITSANCVDATGGQSANPTTATVFLTDAPGNVQALWVDIDEIYAQGGPRGRHSLVREATGLIEVSALVESVQEIASKSIVRPGRYTQLRMVIRGAVLETATGEVLVFGDAVHPSGTPATGTLECPSCAQSGLKIKTNKGGMALLGGESNALVFDMDIKQSLTQSGKAWRLAPVVHAVRTTLGDGDGKSGPAASAGMLAGVVESTVDIPACPAETRRSISDFVPEITSKTVVDSDGQPMMRTASVNPLTGTFVIDFLEADQYRLGYARNVVFDDWQLEFTAHAAPATANVKRGPVAATALYRITGAACSRLAQGD